MSNLIYECKVQNNAIQSETGTFFKAAPFTVSVGTNTYSVHFEKNSSGKVMHTLHHNNTIILELEHPDYSPSCTPDALNQTLNNNDAQAIFAACCHCGVTIEKAYIDFFKSDESPSLSYHITQESLFDA